MSNDPNVQKVTEFVTKLLVSLATEKSISVGVTDIPVLGAFKALKPGDYKKVLRGLAAQPGVSEFVLQIMNERAAQTTMKNADAEVRR